MAVNPREEAMPRRRLPDMTEFFKGSPQMRLGKGDFVCMPSDAADRIFLVFSGCIRVKAYSREGGERIFIYAYPGHTFCEPGVLVGRHTGIAADAIEPSTVGWISRDEVHRRIDTDPVFAKAMIQLLATKLRWRSSQVVRSSFSNAVRQVAAALVNLGTEAAGGQLRPVDIPITHSELASYIGVSRVSVTNSLAQLETDGLVMRKPGSVFLSSPEALVHWLSIPTDR